MKPEDIILKICYCLLIAMSGGIIALSGDIGDCIGWTLILVSSILQILRIK